MQGGQGKGNSLCKRAENLEAYLLHQNVRSNRRPIYQLANELILLRSNTSSVTYEILRTVRNMKAHQRIHKIGTFVSIPRQTDSLTRLATCF